MKIVRETPVVDYEVTPDGVVLRTYGVALTWDEWKQLVEAVKPPDILGTEWYQVTVGKILPGDRVNGVESGPGQWFNWNVSATNLKVMRRKVSGYSKVTQGVVCSDDLVYDGEHLKYTRSTTDQIGSGIGNFHCVQRRI